MIDNANKREKIDILGISVDKVSMSEAVEAFETMLEEDKSSVIVTPNSEMVMMARKDGELAEIIASADLVIPDGIGLVKASKILGTPLPERVTGIDFAFNALKKLAEKGGSVYLLGSKPGIAQTAAAKLAEKIPKLRIAGIRDGYFKSFEENDIVEEINKSGADFLCVALGSPKQEKFISSHKDKLKVKAAVGVGGSFDVWSGSLERAPDFYIKHNLEWLYRMLQEPSRIKRFWKLPLFLIEVFAAGRQKNGH